MENQIGKNACDAIKVRRDKRRRSYAMIRSPPHTTLLSKSNTNSDYFQRQLAVQPPLKVMSQVIVDQITRREHLHQQPKRVLSSTN